VFKYNFPVGLLAWLNGLQRALITKHIKLYFKLGKKSPYRQIQIAIIQKEYLKIACTDYQLHDLTFLANIFLPRLNLHNLL
jgi:hypothetical protein